MQIIALAAIMLILLDIYMRTLAHALITILIIKQPMLFVMLVIIHGSIIIFNTIYI